MQAILIGLAICLDLSIGLAQCKHTIMVYSHRANPGRRQAQGPGLEQWGTIGLCPVLVQV